VRKDRPSTKTCIVFDASAKYHGVSLNDVIHQGAKLQQEFFDVLIHFRRYPVALMCDIAEIYLRIELYPEDRSCHRFLWRDLNISKKPIEYDLIDLYLALTHHPFWLSLCHSIMLSSMRKVILELQKPF